jgi:hypothetical protein
MARKIFEVAFVQSRNLGLEWYPVPQATVDFEVTGADDPLTLQRLRDAVSGPFAATQKKINELIASRARHIARPSLNARTRKEDARLIDSGNRQIQRWLDEFKKEADVLLDQFAKRGEGRSKLGLGVVLQDSARPQPSTRRRSTIATLKPRRFTTPSMPCRVWAMDAGARSLRICGTRRMWMPSSQAPWRTLGNSRRAALQARVGAGTGLPWSSCILARPNGNSWTPVCMGAAPRPLCSRRGRRRQKVSQSSLPDLPPLLPTVALSALAAVAPTFVLAWNAGR